MQFIQNYKYAPFPFHFTDAPQRSNHSAQALSGPTSLILSIKYYTHKLECKLRYWFREAMLQHLKNTTVNMFKLNIPVSTLLNM